MSAAEIIEQIKALPPEERRQVEEFVKADREVRTIRYANAEQAKEAGEKVVARFPETFRRLAE